MLVHKNYNIFFFSARKTENTEQELHNESYLLTHRGGNENVLRILVRKKF